MGGGEAVVDAEPGVAGVVQRAEKRADLAGLVAPDPAAAVDEDTGGKRAVAIGRGQVEFQAHAVGGAVFDIGFLKGSETGAEQEQGEEVTHAGHNPVRL